MKRKFLLLSLSAGIAVLTFSSYGGGPFQNGAGNHTGSAGSTADCSTGSGCHSTNGASTTAALSLTTLTNVPVTKYTGGTTYKVVLTGGNTGGSLPRYGFQASCVKATATSTQEGTFTSTSGSISVRNAGALKLVEHNTPIVATSTSGANSVYITTFNWTAPVAGTGTVRFYAMLNAVNNSGTSLGDQPNAAAPLDVPEATTGIAGVTVAHLSIYPNPATSILRLNLEGAGRTCSIQITDITGRVVAMQQADVTRGEAVADVSHLKTGNYHLLAIQDGKQYFAPFVKN